MDYRKEVMRKKEQENSGDQKIILILSSLILVAIIIVGVIIIKMLSDNNKQLQDKLDYIFPYSNTRYLEEADLEGIPKEEISIGKNEIYARHGRKFNKQLYQEYFSSKDWYEGTVEPEDDSQIEAKFNKYERANLEFLQQHQ